MAKIELIVLWALFESLMNVFLSHVIKWIRKCRCNDLNTYIADMIALPPLLFHSYDNVYSIQHVYWSECAGRSLFTNMTLRNAAGTSNRRGHNDNKYF